MCLCHEVSAQEALVGRSSPGVLVVTLGENGAREKRTQKCSSQGQASLDMRGTRERCELTAAGVGDHWR